jgi:WD40-like Beta Propeller Repeat
MSATSRIPAWLIPLALLAACDPGSHALPSAPGIGITAMMFSIEGTPWSAPVNLAAVNATTMDAHPDLSKDELSLYFTSDRPGGVGGNDIWVSQRACSECDWQPPVNVSALNTTGIDAAPALSIDGHWMFFHSNRAGGRGGNDIYVSRRADPKDDFGWGPPQLLGPDVSTAADENAPVYLQSAEDGPANLYFTRGVAGTQGQDLYVAAVTRNGETLGPAVLASDLYSIVNDAAPTVRTDGREMLFHSPRAGTLGVADLWVSTRPNVSEPWSTPVNVGAPLNTPSFDQQPSLSYNGRTLVWASDRPGGSGGLDIWMATRNPGGQ